MSIGSLNLMAPADMEWGKQQLEVANIALQDVARRGFVFPQPPQTQYQGTLPNNIIHLDDNALGDLLSHIAEWLGFAQSELAKARAARNEAEAKMSFVKARIRLAVKATAEKKTSNPEMDDIVTADARYIEAQRNYLYCEAVHDYTRQLVESGQRDWDTVSRRITQRGQDVERMIRGQSVGGAPVPVAASAFRR